jgi:hypothetical protein
MVGTSEERGSGRERVRRRMNAVQTMYIHIHIHKCRNDTC